MKERGWECPYWCQGGFIYQNWRGCLEMHAVHVPFCNAGFFRGIDAFNRFADCVAMAGGLEHATRLGAARVEGRIK